uniref:Uncharacterized protein n=1 Tax=Physcomitrium patens TaxID=3218 RepID=A0A2K1KUR2_PHYPA|nr:hypothetical protein PHYPA_004495 [Physcomitrium patens]
MEMATLKTLSLLPPPGLSDQQQIVSASILLQIVMLGLAFVLGHVLRRRKIYNINLTSISLHLDFNRASMANKPSIVRLISSVSDILVHFVRLSLTIFSNFGAICLLAMLGTFIASIVTEILVYLGGIFYLMYKMSFRESIMYGELCSEFGTDVNLYALVFGESVLKRSGQQGQFYPGFCIYMLWWFESFWFIPILLESNFNHTLCSCRIGRVQINFNIHEVCRLRVTVAGGYLATQNPVVCQDSSFRNTRSHVCNLAFPGIMCAHFHQIHPLGGAAFSESTCA